MSVGAWVAGCLHHPFGGEGSQRSRLWLPGRAAKGEIDAIFEEGVVVWADKVEDAGMRFLGIDEDHLVDLECIGFRRGKIEKSRFNSLPADVVTLDFSGWPIYARVDTSDLLIRKFCEAMEAKKDVIPWNFGPLKQPNMPLEKMVVESAATPIDLPFHRAAQEFWIKMGYLK